MHREEQRAERAALVEISTRESTTTVKKTRYGVWLIWYMAGLPVLATLYGFFAPPPDAPNQLFAQQVAAGIFGVLAPSLSSAGSADACAAQRSACMYITSWRLA